MSKIGQGQIEAIKAARTILKLQKTLAHEELETKEITKSKKQKKIIKYLAERKKMLAKPLPSQDLLEESRTQGEKYKYLEDAALLAAPSEDLVFGSGILDILTYRRHLKSIVKRPEKALSREISKIESDIELGFLDRSKFQNADSLKSHIVEKIVKNETAEFYKAMLNLLSLVCGITISLSFLFAPLFPIFLGLTISFATGILFTGLVSGGILSHNLRKNLSKLIKGEEINKRIGAILSIQPTTKTKTPNIFHRLLSKVPFADLIAKLVSLFSKFIHLLGVIVGIARPVLSIVSSFATALMNVLHLRRVSKNLNQTFFTRILPKINNRRFIVFGKTYFSRWKKNLPDLPPKSISDEDRQRLKLKCSIELLKKEYDKFCASKKCVQNPDNLKLFLQTKLAKDIASEVKSEYLLTSASVGLSFVSIGLVVPPFLPIGIIIGAGLFLISGLASVISSHLAAKNITQGFQNITKENPQALEFFQKEISKAGQTQTPQTQAIKTDESISVSPPSKTPPPSPQRRVSRDGSAARLTIH